LIRSQTHLGSIIAGAGPKHHGTTCGKGGSWLKRESSGNNSVRVSYRERVVEIILLRVGYRERVVEIILLRVGYRERVVEIILCIRNME
jgi:hypothetical protein